VRTLKTIVRLSRNNEWNWYWIFICIGFIDLWLISVFNDGYIDDVLIYLFFSFLFFIMIAYQGFEIIRGK
jgi:hypothetical protein